MRGLEDKLTDDAILLFLNKTRDMLNYIETGIPVGEDDGGNQE